MSEDLNEMSRKSILNTHRVIDVGSSVTISPSSISEMMDLNVNESSLSRYRFEIKLSNRVQNIIDEYIVYLTNPDFCHKVKLTIYQANAVKYNLNALSQFLYGDINLAWSIPYLNSTVEHASDLSVDLLISDGIIGFNMDGIEALEKIIEYKENLEQNDAVYSDPGAITDDF